MWKKWIYKILKYTSNSKWFIRRNDVSKQSDSNIQWTAHDELCLVSEYILW